MSKTTEETAKPSREEVIAWYEEQIAMAGLRERLAKLQCKIVQHEAKRIHALGLMAQLKSEGPEEPKAPTIEE
jgi:hypothetical protein